MRTCVWVMAAVCLGGAFALGEEKPNPDQLKKAYDDALVQLKSAQDSKNALAKQNGELTRQLEELNKQLAAARGQVQELQRQVSENDEKNFFLRSCYAAWQRFMRVHPELLVQWKLFIGEDALATPDANPLVDPLWPLMTASRPPARPVSGSPVDPDESPALDR